MNTEHPDALDRLALLVLAKGAPALARRWARAAGSATAALSRLGATDEAALRRRSYAELARLHAAGGRLLAPEHLLLPPIPDPPLLLFARGDTTLLEPSSRRVAVIGTREPDLYGVQVARRFASTLAAAGVVVVSGGARGIDTQAHRAALESGGRTVAVLASGFDHPSPSSARPLHDEIARSGGLLLTEVPPGFDARPHYFPDRNRLIAGLSEVVLIAQAAARSGTLHTAGQARALGRPVLAVPGDVCYRTSTGSNGLLARAEATAATHPRDVLCALGDTAGNAALGRWPPMGRRAPDLPAGWLTAPAHGPSAASTALTTDPRAARITDTLAAGPLSVDALVERVGEPAHLVLAVLGGLELAGVARRTPSGEWSLRPRANGLLPI